MIFSAKLRCFPSALKIPWEARCLGNPIQNHLHQGLEHHFLLLKRVYTTKSVCSVERKTFSPQDCILGVFASPCCFVVFFSNDGRCKSKEDISSYIHKHRTNMYGTFTYTFKINLSQKIGKYSSHMEHIGQRVLRLSPFLATHQHEQRWWMIPVAALHLCLGPGNLEILELRNEIRSPSLKKEGIYTVYMGI